MGMSASQARLIALTARMSDTEYEAQQINQQRVTLSNQMNAVYESMVNMDVPTPPSKLDPQYMKSVYRGNLGGNRITVRPDGNGRMAAYRTVKNGNIVSNAGGQNVGKVCDPKDFVNQTTVYTADQFKPYDTNKMTHVVYPQDLGKFSVADYTEFVKGSYKLTYTDGTTEDVTITGDMTRDQLPQENSLVNGKTVQSVDLSGVETVCYTKAVDSSSMIQDGIYRSTEFGNAGKDNNGNYIEKTGKDIDDYNNNVADLADNKSFAVETESGFRVVTIEEIRSGKVEGKIYECTNPVQLTLSMEAKKNQLKIGDTTVGGNPVVSLETARATYAGNKDFETALSGLKNTFSTYSDDNLNKQFLCIIGADSKNNLTFSFCMKDDISNGDDSVSVYEVGVGSYEQQITDIKEFDPEKIKYDVNGNVKSAVICDEEITMTIDNEFDEYEYEAAVNEYNSQKAVYDHEQNVINKQTSIYQRQDKMLELKLTRLENERNALKTEIDAVKKVIQDSVDRGFKTFSG